MNSLADSIGIWLADYYLLASVLLGAALATSWFLKQPAQRLAVTKATIAALFLLALLCAIPGWSLIHLFTSEQPRANGSQVAPLKQPRVADLPTIPVADSIDTESPAFSAPAAQLNEQHSPPQTATNWRDLPWAQIVVTAHCAGTVSVFAWLVLGAIAAHRLQRTAQSAPAELNAVLAEVAALQNISSRLPDLKITDRVNVAVALGIFRPTVLLPTDWLKSHAPDQLRTVLAHELAHVANHDLRWLAASRALVMLQWAQPLLWFVRRGMRLDQEALADAAAAELTGRERYAEQLIAWAHQMPACPTVHLSAAVGLWEGPSQLRQRIALLIDERFTVLRNCSHGSRRSAILAALAAALVLSLVTLEPNRQADAETNAAEKVNPSTPLTNKAADTENGTESRPAKQAFSGSATISTVFGELRSVPGSQANSIVGRCVDENGAPLSGLRVVLLHLRSRGQSPEVKSETTTDALGIYRFENVVDFRTAFPNGRVPVIPPANEHFFQVVIRGAGRVTTIQLASTFDVARNGYSWEHTLRPAATLRGRVVGPDGKPVSRGLVTVGFTMYRRLEGAQSARTDNDGRYEINDVAPFDAEIFRAEQEAMRLRNQQSPQVTGTLRPGVSLSVSTGPPMFSVEHPNFALLKAPCEQIPGTKDVQLEPAAIIEGRVVYGNSGQPAANVRLRAQTPLPERLPPRADFIYRAHTVYAQTGNDGKFRITTLPQGTYEVWPLADGWLYPRVNVQTQANQITTVPELRLTRGGIVRIRLVSADDGKPVAVGPNDEATFWVQQVDGARFVEAPTQTVKSQPDGTYETRALPGRNVVTLRAVVSAAQVKWVGSQQRPTLLDVPAHDNAIVSIDVPVIDGKAAQLRGNNSNADESNSRVASAMRLVIERKYQEALPILSTILKDHPEHVNALLARAEAWQQLREYTKAVADYELLLKLDPPFPRKLIVHNNLAYLLAACPDDGIRDGKRAVELAERAKQLQEPPSHVVLDTLAAAYAEAGDFDRAIRTQQEAVKLEPTRNRYLQHLQLYQSGKPLRDLPLELPGSAGDDELPAAESQTESDANAGAAAQPVDIPIIVARHVMLLEGKIIEWADVERLVTALPNPKLANPSFMFTHGALPTREEEIRTKIWDLRKRVTLSGHSWGSLSPRTSAHYDSIRTAADLVPDAAWRIDGMVQTADGLPIDGAQIVLLLPAPESLSYKTLDVYLRNEQLRNPDDEIATRSDVSGRFAVYPPPDTPYYLIALHREGFGLVRSDDFAKSRSIAIQPWAHVKGRVQSDERFEQSAVVRVTLPTAADWPELQFHQYSEDLGPPSPDGRFELAFVPPSLKGSLSRSVKGEQGSSFSLPVKEFQLAPGETLTADIEPPSNAEVERVEELKSSLEKNTREGEAPPDEDVTQQPAASVNQKPVGIPIIVARHVMLHEGRIIEWADVERLIAALPDPKLAQPNFKFTTSALPEREEEIRAKMLELRRRVQLHGHTSASASPQVSARYDGIRTPTDLIPNEIWRVDGTVITTVGAPVDGAEVVLLADNAEQSLGVFVVNLWNDRLRDPDDQIVTHSNGAGRFTVYPQLGAPYYLVALHREGFGMVRSDEFSESQRITIKPWAHVKGRIEKDERIALPAAITQSVKAQAKWPELIFLLHSSELGIPSPDGRFEFAFVPPSLESWLCRAEQGERGSISVWRHKELQVAPGETLTADIERLSDADMERFERVRRMQERLGTARETK